MQNREKWLMMGIAFMVFALFKVGLLLWWQSRQPHHQTSITNCVINQTHCLFGQGSYIQLNGVKDNHTPFSIRITNAPPQTQQITASFSMKDMDMGFNRYILTKQADGSWLINNVRLPLCTQSRHEWLIQWQMDKQHFQATFQTQPS